MGGPACVWRASRAELVVCLALVGLVAVVYARAVGFDFVNYDDSLFVAANPWVRSGLTLAGARWAFSLNGLSQYHPLTWLSYMADTSLFGTEPWGYHLTNVLLHAGAALLLFHLLVRTTASRGASATVAALFAVHPLRVESVVWVAERKDVLSVLLALACLLAYAGYAARPSSMRYLGMLALLGLGLLAKPMLVTLPAVMLLLDVWPLGRAGWGTGAVPATPWWRLLLEKAPLLALAGASGVLTVIAQQRAGASRSLAMLPLGVRVANACRGYLWYVGKLFWPTDLAVFYPYGQVSSLALTVACAVLLAAATAAAVASARRFPYLLAGWLWFVVTLLPVIGLVQVGDQSVADRYSYLPHIGLLLALVWSGRALLAAATRPVRVAAAAAVGVAVTLLASLAWVQVGTWRDGATLFAHAIQVTKDNYMAHNNLAVALAERGELDAAAYHYRQAIRILPQWEAPHFGLGALLDREGATEAALTEYLRGLRSKPSSAEAQKLAGLACLKLGRAEQARVHLEAARALAPEDPEIAAILRGLAAGEGGAPVPAPSRVP